MVRPQAAGRDGPPYRQLPNTPALRLADEDENDLSDVALVEVRNEFCRPAKSEAPGKIPDCK
jgi:hypothetical protein